MPKLSSLDHLVLTVSDIDQTIGFYQTVLGMEKVGFEGADGCTRFALVFGAQKINLHQQGKEISPHAAFPSPGSADLCFLTETPLELWLEHFEQAGVLPLSGIVPRTGATGPIRSVYLRDPDENLIEISNPT